MTATTIELLAAGSVLTATGQGTSKAVPTITMAALAVNLIAFSGSGATFTAWLEGLIVGTSWCQIPYDWRIKSSAAATDITSGTAGNRNAVNVETATSIWLAVYKHLPFDYVRLAYVISGTSPNVTLGAWLKVK
jgi:hypothetical protein